LESSSIGISNDRFVWTDEDDGFVAWYRPPGPPPPACEEDITIALKVVVVFRVLVLVERKERPTPDLGVKVTRERRSIKRR
jgi:hypothetical protein